jgi:hypothetical protein
MSKIDMRGSRLTVRTHPFAHEGASSRATRRDRRGATVRQGVNRDAGRKPAVEHQGVLRRFVGRSPRRQSLEYLLESAGVVKLVDAFESRGFSGSRRWVSSASRRRLRRRVVPRAVFVRLAARLPSIINRSTIHRILVLTRGQADGTTRRKSGVHHRGGARSGPGRGAASSCRRCRHRRVRHLCTDPGYGHSVGGHPR